MVLRTVSRVEFAAAAYSVMNSLALSSGSGGDHAESLAEIGRGSLFGLMNNALHLRIEHGHGSGIIRCPSSTQSALCSRLFP